MEKLVVHPKDEHQLNVLKTFLEERNIQFDVKINDLPSFVIEEVKIAKTQSTQGKVIPFSSMSQMVR